MQPRMDPPKFGFRLTAYLPSTTAKHAYSTRDNYRPFPGHRLLHTKRAYADTRSKPQDTTATFYVRTCDNQRIRQTGGCINLLNTSSWWVQQSPDDENVKKFCKKMQRPSAKTVRMRDLNQTIAKLNVRQAKTWRSSFTQLWLVVLRVEPAVQMSYSGS